MALSASSPVALETPPAGKLTKNAPPIAASPPATAHAPAATRPRRMPINDAASGSEAADRIATPQFERVNANQKTQISTSATIAAAIRACGMSAPKMLVVPAPQGAPDG